MCTRVYASGLGALAKHRRARKGAGLPVQNEEGSAAETPQEIRGASQVDYARHRVGADTFESTRVRIDLMIRKDCD